MLKKSILAKILPISFIFTAQIVLSADLEEPKQLLPISAFSVLRDNFANRIDFDSSKIVSKVAETISSLKIGEKNIDFNLPGAYCFGLSGELVISEKILQKLTVKCI